MGPGRACFALISTALIAATAAGCAGGREAARAPYMPYELAPQREPDEPLPSRRPATRRAGSGSIEGSLSRFAGEERAARATLAAGSAMPEDAAGRWATILGAVDELLRHRGAGVTPLEFIRARVTLEAELDADRGHYQPLPDGLEASVRARALALEQRLRLSRSFQPAVTIVRSEELRWPIEPAFVTSLFGYRLDPLTGEERNHLGLDLRANAGQAVRAAAPGTVLRAARTGGHGLMVELLHPGGLRTRYSHLSSALVSVGARIAAGDVVGLAGSSGRSTGPHLHFEIWRNGEPTDPLAELPEPDGPLLTSHR